MKEKEIIEDLLDLFEEQYRPATGIFESDDQLSSNEVITLFNSATEITKEEIYNGLKARGFVTKMVGNQFLWLVKEQKSPS